MRAWSLCNDVGNAIEAYRQQVSRRRQVDSIFAYKIPQKTNPGARHQGAPILHQILVFDRDAPSFPKAKETLLGFRANHRDV